MLPAWVLCLLEQLIEALQANEPDTFKRWLYGGIQDLGEIAVTELVLDWLLDTSSPKPSETGWWSRTLE